MPMLSRYLATVRRATWIPCSSKSDVSLLSLRGLAGCSAPIISFRIAQTAVEEHSPPLAVPTWLEKKYFSSKMPCGVARYLVVVTREMVDSCSSSLLAMSDSTMGFIAMGPKSRNPCCRSTMVMATRISVSLRLSMLRRNQRASARLSLRNWLSLLLSAHLISVE